MEFPLMQPLLEKSSIQGPETRCMSSLLTEKTAQISAEQGGDGPGLKGEPTRAPEPLAATQVAAHGRLRARSHTPHGRMRRPARTRRGDERPP